MRPIVLSLAITLGFTLAPQAASADLPPPQPCRTVGETCYGGPFDPGVCAMRKCSRPTPSGTVEYDCLACVPKPKDKPKK